MKGLVGDVVIFVTRGDWGRGSIAGRGGNDVALVGAVDLREGALVGVVITVVFMGIEGMSFGNEEEKLESMSDVGVSTLGESPE